MKTRASAVVLALAGLGLFVVQQSLAQEPPPPAYRVAMPLTARDEGLRPPSATPAPTLVPTPEPPPPGPGYCQPTGIGVPFPPNTVFGLLTIGGEPAPALTLVTLTFDGQPGPSAYTTAAGGYRVNYAGGGAGHEPRCINEVGTVMGLLVNGVNVSFGIAVGDPDAGLVLRYDVAIP